MTDNVFMISDASFSHKTNCAGIGAIDLSTGKKYSEVLYDIQTSHVAEYRALLLSVRIALKNKYNNVVFVYDNQSLQLDSLKEWLRGKIDTYQFLWLKRVYLEHADKLANKARILYEKLIVQEILKEKITDGVLIERFKGYAQTKIMRAFLTLANHDEQVILKTYIKNQQYTPVLVDSKSLNFYSDIYNLLRLDKNRARFFKFIDKNYAGIIDMQVFATPKTDEYYLVLIKKMLKKLLKRTVATQISTLPLSDKIYETRIQNLQAQSYKERMKFCLSKVGGSDKDLLNAYFSAKKTTAIPNTKGSIEFLLFIHYILPDKQKKSFFGFIKNRLKKNNSQLYKLWHKRDNAFYLAVARKIL